MPPLVVTVIGTLYILAACALALEVGVGELNSWRLIEAALLAGLGGGLLSQKRWAWAAELVMCWLQLALIAGLAGLVILNGLEMHLLRGERMEMLFFVLAAFAILNAGLIAYLRQPKVRAAFS